MLVYVISLQKAYAIRMIYIGEHGLPNKEEFIAEFRKTIHDVNASYCEIPVTGFLLVYDSYFVHIIEVCYKIVNMKLHG